MHNNRIHSGSKMRRSFVALLFTVGDDSILINHPLSDAKMAYQKLG